MISQITYIKTVIIFISHLEARWTAFFTEGGGGVV